MEPGVEAKETADRLMSYCDAVIAVSFVNCVAFFIAIAEGEVRCSLTAHRPMVVVVGLIMQFVYLTAIVLFRRAEVRLRREAGSDSAPTVERYRGNLHRARLAVVTVIAFAFVVLAWHGLEDPSCPL